MTAAAILILAACGTRDRLKPGLRTPPVDSLQGSEFRLQAVGSQNENCCDCGLGEPWSCEAVECRLRSRSFTLRFLCYLLFKPCLSGWLTISVYGARLCRRPAAALDSMLRLRRRAQPRSMTMPDLSTNRIGTVRTPVPVPALLRPGRAHSAKYMPCAREKVPLLNGAGTSQRGFPTPESARNDPG